MGACVSCDRPLPESRPGSAVPEAERTPSCNLDGSFSSSSSSSSEDGAPPCASVSLPTAAKGLPILAADNVLPLASRPDLARVRLDPKISTNSRLNAPLTNPPAGAATAIRRTATLDMTHLQGTVLLNQYAMVRFLGRGVSGRVFLVMDVLTQRLLALKAVRRPPPGGGLSRSGRRRDPAADLAREIEVMARLHHPNLPRLYEVIDDPGHTKILLVMTLAEGGPVLTRASLEAGRRLPEAEARAAFHGMAKGLAELHRLGIVHGDLKPENVLLGSRVMLTDFGCSGWEGGGVGIHRPRGTPAFLAPELACAEAGPCTPASDVYSLGASLFTLLFGTIPFPATSIAELYEALHTQDLIIPSEPALGEGVRQLLHGCMERDPARRWTLDSVLRHPWARGGGPGPVEQDGAHPFSPLQALLTPDALVHRLQPGAGVDPQCWRLHTSTRQQCWRLHTSTRQQCWRLQHPRRRGALPRSDDAQPVTTAMWARCDPRPSQRPPGPPDQHNPAHAVQLRVVLAFPRPRLEGAGGLSRHGPRSCCGGEADGLSGEAPDPKAPSRHPSHITAEWLPGEP
ncbi:hypothetical protein ACKKBF_B04850 [Auxenochlorella protothecoides x Auxenochlorella symbiontica]